MQGGRTATQAELNYGLRRVVYDVLVTTKAHVSITGRDYSAKEMAKISGLIMARNLDAFLYGRTYNYPDDINVTDYGLAGWRPSAGVHLNRTVSQRISKIAGHVVASQPTPFEDPEARTTILPLVREACDFIRACRNEGIATYTGKASYYIRRLNGTLPTIGILPLPR